MTDLAKLVVRLEAQSAQLQAELEKSTRKIERFERNTRRQLGSIDKAFAQVGAGLKAALPVAGIAAFTTGVVRAASAALEYGDSIDEAARKAGTTTETISELAYAFKTVDVDLNGTTTSLKEFQVSLSKAASGSKTEIETLRALGLSFDELRGKDVGDQIAIVADRIAALPDPTDRARAATELFGRAGVNLIPLLEQGSAGIEKLRVEAEKTGKSLSGENAKRLADAKESVDKLSASFDGLATALTAKAAPALSKFFDRLRVTIAGSDVEKLDAKIQRLRDAIKLNPNDATTSSLERQLAEAELERNALTAAADVAAFDRAVAARNAPKPDAPPGFGSGGGDGKAKDPLDALQIRVTAQRREVGELEKFYRQLDESTQTSAEKTVASYEETKQALEELLAAGRITVEQYNARIDEAISSALPELEVTVDKVQEKVAEVDEFSKQLARNTVDIIADTLVDGFDGGLKDLPERFGRLLLQLSAQAVAADLGRKIFGSAAGGEGSGIFGKAISAVGGLFGFGGSRDKGGRGYPGMAYAIGTGAQPEVFVPDTAGTFYPAGSGGMQINQSFTIAAPAGTVSRSTELQIAAAAARGVQSANRRNN